MARILYSLIALALIFSPLAMSRAGMAMASGAAAGMEEGHCSDHPAGKDREQAMIDCLGICSAIAQCDQRWGDSGHILAAAVAASNVPVLTGLHPESELPPPRFS